MLRVSYNSSKAIFSKLLIVSKFAFGVLWMIMKTAFDTQSSNEPTEKWSVGRSVSAVEYDAN